MDKSITCFVLKLKLHTIRPTHNRAPTWPVLQITGPWVWGSAKERNNILTIKIHKLFNCYSLKNQNQMSKTDALTGRADSSSMRTVHILWFLPFRETQLKVNGLMLLWFLLFLCLPCRLHSTVHPNWVCSLDQHFIYLMSMKHHVSLIHTINKTSAQWVNTTYQFLRRIA